jgi:ubiquinone/menaquinone biosynthesis C-methylase UbiE
MDYSAKQLENDRMVAEREHLTLNTVQADMTKPFPFEDESFDIVFCPVSNVFIEDLTMMWTECYRVLKRNGLLMVGYMNPWLYMFDADDVWNDENIPLIPKYSIPFNSRKLEQEGRIQISPEHGYEFSHTLEEQIGGQLKAGFAMIDFYESNDARNRLSQYGNLYLANLSIKL